MLIFITEPEGKIKSIAGGLNTEMISREMLHRSVIFLKFNRLLALLESILPLFHPLHALVINHKSKETLH